MLRIDLEIKPPRNSQTSCHLSILLNKWNAATFLWVNSTKNKILTISQVNIERHLELSEK